MGCARELGPKRCRVIAPESSACSLGASPATTHGRDLFGANAHDSVYDGDRTPPRGIRYGDAPTIGNVRLRSNAVSLLRAAFAGSCHASAIANLELAESDCSAVALRILSQASVWPPGDTDVNFNRLVQFAQCHTPSARTLYDICISVADRDVFTTVDIARARRAAMWCLQAHRRGGPASLRLRPRPPNPAVNLDVITTVFEHAGSTRGELPGIDTAPEGAATVGHSRSPPAMEVAVPTADVASVVDDVDGPREPFTNRFGFLTFYTTAEDRASSAHRSASADHLLESRSRSAAHRGDIVYDTSLVGASPSAFALRLAFLEVGAAQALRLFAASVGVAAWLVEHDD